MSPIHSLIDWNRLIFLPAALCSAIPGGLVARMFRFDYQRHLDISDHAEETVPVIVPPPPSRATMFFKKEHFVEGILIPQRAPRSFLKPYYVLALGKMDHRAVVRRSDIVTTRRWCADVKSTYN
ncbi:hypothetical protein Clacol_008081 [Clathrus columnatus]|uniref:Uncharacterized protein n=1 Tax=Clathrus columnatus TaxID=1419009 RepID=A0AAV5AM82_9AGAM|nr:hypothetical protein Clacol_008081 [Clathrus columnatus]